MERMHEASDSLLPLDAYRPARLRYRHDEACGGLRHNFDRDLQMFVLWEHAGPSWDRIVADLAQRFDVIHVRHVTWPAADVDNNFLRLYGSAPLDEGTDATVFRRREIVGAGTFAIVVVEDREPSYVYDRTFSRKVEVVSRRVIEAKAIYREWTGGGFRVHSSNSLGEFFRDMSLLVGVDELDRLIATPVRSTAPVAVSGSLAGAGGWPDLAHLFAHLARATRYVVLRNFESLPESLAEGDADIDALCDLPPDFAAIANATVKVDRDGKFACLTRVAGADMPIDLRRPGDGYFDEFWQEQALATGVEQRGVRVLSADQHFFSLLYHAKVHKRAVKPSYRERLRRLGDEIGMPHFKGQDFTADEVAAEVLGGYMASRHYRVALPLDVWVAVNGPFVGRLQAHGLVWEQERLRGDERASALLARLPLLWRWRRRLAAPLAGLTRRAQSWMARRAT